jgi:hypothetical protein
MHTVLTLCNEIIIPLISFFDAGISFKTAATLPTKKEEPKSSLGIFAIVKNCLWDVFSCTLWGVCHMVLIWYYVRTKRVLPPTLLPFQMAPAFDEKIQK